MRETLKNILMVEYRDAPQADDLLALLRQIHHKGGVELVKYAVIRTKTGQQPDILIRQVNPPYFKAMVLAAFLGVLSGINLAIFAEAIPFIGQVFRGNVIDWSASFGVDQSVVIIVLALLAGASSSMLSVGRGYIGALLGKVVTRVTHQRQPAGPKAIWGKLARAAFVGSVVALLYLLYSTIKALIVERFLPAPTPVWGWIVAITIAGPLCFGMLFLAGEGARDFGWWIGTRIVLTRRELLQDTPLLGVGTTTVVARVLFRTTEAAEAARDLLADGKIIALRYPQEIEHALVAQPQVAPSSSTTSMGSNAPRG